jgi:hypothetical protein
MVPFELKSKSLKLDLDTAHHTGCGVIDQGDQQPGQRVDRFLES